MTSADAGSRRVRLEIEDGTNVMAASAPSADHPASVTARYWSALGTHPSYENDTTVVTDSDVQIPMPDILMFEGYRIAITTDNFDTVAAADDWTGGFLNVEEWLLI